MKLAIVLPGGGACGRWQIGVLKYLYDTGLIFDNIDLVCGTSVGGLNALLIGKYKTNFQPACDMWTRIKSNKDIFLGMLQFNTFWDYLGMAGQTFKTNKGKSILDPAPLYHLLDKEFGDLKLIDMKVNMIITTTDMSTGERMAFTTDTDPFYKCAELGKATSAIPLAFPGVNLAVNGKNDLHNDGGILRNNPVCYAIDRGATHIILIGTSPDKYPRKEIKNNVLDIALRMQDVIMHANEEASWDEKEDYEDRMKLNSNLPTIKFLDIYPEESTGSALDFSNVEQFGKGYGYARENLPPIILESFLRI
jgi:predicted acylesterase/phospholipase RssA